MERISVAEPTFLGREREYVVDCIDTNWISSNGKYIGKFEQAFAEFVGTRHAVATNNGTTGLHLALVALGIGHGDEVIVPTVTYIASANAVRYTGATPVFADVDAETLNLEPTRLESLITPRTKAIMPVHLYGHPADMTAIARVAHTHGLVVVEDAAEAHGAEVDGRRVGSIGDCGVFSFFGNKIITTGEGGMVTTDDDALAARLRLLRGQGMSPDRRYWFEVVGFNYRMTNIEAAIGLGQLEQIDQNLAARDYIGRLYDEVLAPYDDLLRRPVTRPGTRPVQWMYTVFLRSGGEAERDRFISDLDAAGIETRPVFYPMHLMPPYAETSRYPVADTWYGRGVNLPTHLGLRDEDIRRIGVAIGDALRR